MEEREQIQLEGGIRSVIFCNEQNGYTVLEIENGEDCFPAVGVLPPLHAGEHVIVRGYWGTHKDYGRQFQIQAVEVVQPRTETQILRYLASGAVRGIGPALAERIVERFGAQTLQIMEKEPRRLAEIKGISLSKSEEIARSYAEQFGLRSVMLFLQQYGLTPSECVRIWKKLGGGATDTVKKNPYVLCTLIRMPFDRADEIAQAFGIEPHASCRLMAGLLYVLRHNRQNGHTYLPKDKLLPVACKLLDASVNQMEDALDMLVDLQSVVVDTVGETQVVFLPDCHRAEQYIADRIALLRSAFPGSQEDYGNIVARIEKSLQISYAPEQKQAIDYALRRGALVLTGGPGTGKTTVIRGIIMACESIGLKVCLAAPTGRAAKRMTELTGVEAKTIHRLLEAEFDENDVSRFARNERNTLDYTAIILDEASMIDAVLMESMLRAMKLNCRLILVGDADQLPSVGAGNVLRDLIDSGAIPTVRLEHIFRQAAESLIITNSHRVVRGEMPLLDQKDSDFFFLSSESESLTRRTVCDLVSRRLPDAYGFSPLWDIQVLTPSRRAGCGTVVLNAALQEALNPAGAHKHQVVLRGITFREGDKVMQVRNNYDLIWTDEKREEGSGIFNGDIGIIETIDAVNSNLRICFDGRRVDYGFELCEDLELAYAITAHKSQGSEFPAVVLALSGVPSKLVYRNLFYTAITRARELLVLVGSGGTIAKMVSVANRNARFTALQEFLRREMKA